MAAYVLRRILYAVFVVWAAYTITFVLLYLLPADPISIMLSGSSDGAVRTSDAERAALEAQFGFDKPVPVQYLTLLGAAVRGDLGTSVQSGEPVRTVLAEALPHTIALAGLGLVFALVLGVLIAVTANFTTNRFVSHLVFSVPPFLAAIPSFLIALVLMKVFAFQLGLFPSRGTQGFASLVLPALTLGLAISASIGQVLGKGIRDTLREPYVDVLRTKGVSRWGIQVGHALKNAAIPALTIVALVVGGLTAGAVVTETIYARSGVGRLLQSAVNTQDIPTVQAIVIISAIAFALVNLAVDLVYPLVDPRIRRIAAEA